MPVGHQDAVDAWAALLRVHAALVPRMDRTLARTTGLSLSQYDVLLELRAADAPLRMSELAQRTVVSRSRVSRIVDELSATGLVCREGDSTDRRAQHAVLTDDGRQALRAAWPAYRDIIVELVGTPLGDDAAHVALSLSRILRSSDGDTSS